jgi:hypothetical protein
MSRPWFVRISQGCYHNGALLSCFARTPWASYGTLGSASRPRRLASTVSAANPRREDPYFQISEEVHHAIMMNKPVVALETTIYTHGFPYPDNVALALELEATVRSNGAIPATIGIVSGIARVGLSAEELTALASTAGRAETMKVSRRDLPYIIGMVSTTIYRLKYPLECVSFGATSYSQHSGRSNANY